MAREQSYAAERKAQVIEHLKTFYPDYKKIFKLTCKNWSTGGAVYVTWTDGPARDRVAELLGIFHDSIIMIDLERSYTSRFLQDIATPLCTIKGWEIPAIHEDRDGTVHVDIWIKDIMISREIYKYAHALDASDIDALAFYEDKYGFHQTTLTLKQDYSEGVYPEYAIIGGQGYGLMSGPNVRWYIHRVYKRHGDHRVEVIIEQDAGFCSYYIEVTKKALQQIGDSGKIEIKCTNGVFHY